VLNALVPRCAGIRRAGACALDLAYVAAGRLDGFWESGLNPWNVAAGTLLVTEAGGRVGDFAGGRDFLRANEVIAAAPVLQNAAVQQTESVSNLQIQELPQAARDFTRLLVLQPGSVSNSTEFLQNGLPGIGISVTVDGVDASGDPEGPAFSSRRNLINVMSQRLSGSSTSTKASCLEIGRAFSGTSIWSARANE
jgi:hypothetical protein